MNYRKLQDELETDPKAAGYSGMTSQQKADEINAVDKVQNRLFMSRSEIYENIEASALAGLTDSQVGQLNLALSDSIDPFGNASQVFIDVFGGNSATITALGAARKEMVSRGSQIGISEVSEQMINVALAGEG